MQNCFIPAVTFDLYNKPDNFRERHHCAYEDTDLPKDLPKAPSLVKEAQN